jgi:Type II secretion system protein C
MIGDMKWLPKDPDYALTVPLGALCLLLIAGLMLESLVFRRPGTDQAPPSVTSAAEQPPLIPEGEGAFELPQVDEFADFVDRPLLVEGRKPPPPEEEQKQQAEAQDATPLSLKLMGVLFSPSGEMAILAEQTGKNRRVRKGATLNGWKLVELHRDRVTLQRGEERRDLQLLKPKPKSGSLAGAQGQPPGSVPGGPPGKRGGRPPVEPPVETEDPDAEVVEDTGEGEDTGDADVEDAGEEMPEGEE